MGFKKDDPVIFDNGKEKLQGSIIRLDTSFRLPIRVKFTNGSTRSYTIDGRASKHGQQTLFLDNMTKETPTFKKGDLVEKRVGDTVHKGVILDDQYEHPTARQGLYTLWVEFENSSRQSFTKDGRYAEGEEITLFLEELPKLNFGILDFVEHKRSNGSLIRGHVVNVNHSKKDYPILVKFADETTRCFTNDGRLIDGGIIDLFLIDKHKPESIFKKGDDVVYQESEGSWLHGVVCYVDTDGRGFPIEVEFNGSRNKKSFTADGRFLPNGKVLLKPVSKLSEMIGNTKTISEKFLNTVKNSKGIEVNHPREASTLLPPINLSPELEKELQKSSPKVIIIEELDNVVTVKEQDYDHVSAPHYRQSPIEAIDIFEKVYGAEMTAMWCEITALKYRLRLGHKPTSPVEDDLKKEKWYLEKRGELLKKVPRPVN